MTAPIPLADQIACVERELALRRNVYRNRVRSGQMPQATADLELARLGAVLETLGQVKTALADVPPGAACVLTAMTLGGEPAARDDDAGDDDAEGCAEREVGRHVYRIVSALMNAEPGTPQSVELAYLAALVADVEEYGADTLMTERDLAGADDILVAAIEKAARP